MMDVFAAIMTFLIKSKYLLYLFLSLLFFGILFSTWLMVPSSFPRSLKGSSGCGLRLNLLKVSSESVMWLRL